MCSVSGRGGRNMLLSVEFMAFVDSSGDVMLGEGIMEGCPVALTGLMNFLFRSTIRPDPLILILY